MKRGSSADFPALNLNIKIIIRVLLVVVIVGIGLIQNSTGTWARLQQSGFPARLKENCIFRLFVKKVLKRKKENQHILDVVTEKKSDFSLLKTKGRASFSLASRSVSDRRMLKVKLAVGSVYTDTKRTLTS